MEPKEILICAGTGCISAGSNKIFARLAAEIKLHHLHHVTLKITGCHGLCQRGPIVVVNPDGIFYSDLKEEDIPEIVTSHLQNNIPVERLFYKVPGTDDKISHANQIPFYSKQKRVVLRNCGHVNPENIADYIAVDGYKALRKALFEMSPQQVINEISTAKLRGRGGAGFPTAKKWQSCHDIKSDKKYMICNADEGDPGAFMDCGVLEGDPHSLLEGLIIAGYAIGADEAYIYVRAEYPLAVKRLLLAIKQAEEHGFLGHNILNSGFSYSIHLKEGAGAFVCGEETALMASIEGKTGRPRPRPPYPAQSGLFGKPTTINNVKTLATIPVIINKGSEWFASIGSETCKGTAIFALTGHVINTGLIEVPMGTTLREIIFEIGGGISENRKFKAVQTGGPSGGCLPESFLDSAVDFDTLAKAGSIMGSGGMVVMDERTCIVDVARYFLDFAKRESCGKCGPCRLGTKQMLDTLQKICDGNGETSDIDLLLELSSTVKRTSLCGLGQTAPNPIISTLRYFREEYEAHVRDKKCPACVCKALMHYEIDPQKCIGCQRCFKSCPVSCIAGEPRKTYKIEQAKCIKCGMCFEVCPNKVQAVTKIPGK